MKLPLDIRIGYRIITIDYATPEFKRDNMTDCFGQYLDRENKIEIQPGLTAQEEANTILHEIMHCIFKTLGETNEGMALANDVAEERVVLNTTNLLQQTLFMDNPQLLVFLTKSIKN
jgi:hypothetical protein|tara:strand:+ start:485 stop:835 length:351 start_codon:yes stop_codon:yes gene_type:complete